LSVIGGVKASLTHNGTTETYPLNNLTLKEKIAASGYKVGDTIELVLTGSQIDGKDIVWLAPTENQNLEFASKLEALISAEIPVQKMEE
jgi:hypothetical protein